MQMTRACNDMIDLLAASTVHGLLSFRPGAPAQERIVELIARDTNGELSAEEELELELYLGIEQRLELARAQAQRQLAVVRADAA